jgi:uncharacterized membrane-anchored protein YjiN (DUF445 family)
VSPAPPRPQRRLALLVLCAAAATAVAAFPVRATWWGGWILAVAEAGIVGGLADWFAVTAIFRRPLGLPIPHTALIPANWELMAARVGTMVGDRVLTVRYVTDEIARLDLGGLIERAAARIDRGDLERAAHFLARWAAEQVPPLAFGELVERARQLLLARAWAPTLAAGLEVARERGWDERALAAAARALADALERPVVGAAVADLVDELLQRYRESMRAYPRLWLSVADLFGLIDRPRILAALRTGMRDVAGDEAHPLRGRARAALAAFAGRLRTDPALAARVEGAARELLESEALRELLEEGARALHRTILADVGRERSELVAWVADRLDRVRLDLVADAALRRDLERWLRERVVDLLERQHGRLAQFIEKGVLALGPEGAVRMLEEHAGDDLQYIRVNGTVVGGLAGGAIYGAHLLLGLL